MFNDNNYFGLGVSVGFLASAGLIASLLYGRVVLIGPSKIEEGFIDPKKLEFKLEDFNYNRYAEPIVRLEGVNYMLKWVDGKPVFQEYEVKNLAPMK